MAQDDVSERLEAFLSRLDAGDQPTERQGSTLSFILMTGYCGLAGLSLVGGAVIGSRSFENSAAYEALEALPAATPASEAQAMKYAVRAFGWGTALCMGTSLGCICFARTFLGIRTMEDVRLTAQARLHPLDQWLRVTGTRIEHVGRLMGAAIPDFRVFGSAKMPKVETEGITSSSRSS